MVIYQTVNILDGNQLSKHPMLIENISEAVRLTVQFKLVTCDENKNKGKQNEVTKRLKKQ